MSNSLLADVFIMCSLIFITTTNVCGAQADLYYVNSSGCKMRRVSPFTKELLRIYKREQPETCKSETTLVTSSYKATLARYVLRINKNYKSGKLLCQYQEIVRFGKGERADKKIFLRKAIKFHSPYIVPQRIQSMLVNCFDTTNLTKVLQKNAFAFVQMQYKRNEHAETARKPSVIMIGIDTLSRTNLRRSMPQLFKYLNDNGWHEMQGYNKVGDNTFPNLLAVLTGHLPEAVAKHYCDYHEVGCLNKLPFIWHDYKRAGYVTAYAEDGTNINTFNNLRPSFQAQPVDFYPLPFFLAIERLLVNRKRFGRNYCLGQKLSTSYVYDYAGDFITRFIKKQPFFGFFWVNEYSSGNALAASAFDKTIVTHLERFRKKGLFNESIVIFFSDHGARYGKVRNLPEGFINERLPTLFFWLPLWFRLKYPDYVAALEQNRNRLSSNYDLYLTLQHILSTSGATVKSFQNPLPECLDCQSLFRPLPIDRTCADAGIPQHYCTCDAYLPTSITEVQPIMPLVLKVINDFIAAKHLNAKCSNISLGQIQQAFKKQPATLKQPEISVYRIYFNTIPNNPKYEVTVPYNNHTKEINLDVENISRLTSYAVDSYCIKVKEAFKFCICYNSIHKTKKKSKNITEKPL